MKIYKIENSSTGTYWNGSHWRPGFESNGKIIKTYGSAVKALTRILDTLYSKRAGGTTQAQFIRKTLHNGKPEDLVIREFEIHQIKHELSPLPNVYDQRKIKCHLSDIDSEFGIFYARMIDLKVDDKIEFIFKLKPANGRYMTNEDIKEARKKLRLLKVKTRTFKEHRGMFGFYNRDQAMKARLSLDVISVVDVSAERKKVVV